MKSSAHYYRLLIEEGMSKEDAANLLPLGMTTKVVMKTNLRMIENLMNQRLCNRAYKEMRNFADILRVGLSTESEEWRQIVLNMFVPKCKKVGYCTETKCCGLSEKKEIEWEK
jgi:thymidylate synthase (FAD)